MAQTKGLTPAGIALFNMLAASLAPAVNAGVQQPELVYQPGEPRRGSRVHRAAPAAVAIPAGRGTKQFDVHASGVAIKQEFDGVLTVGAPRPKRNEAAGTTRDAVLTVNGKVVASATMSDAALSRLAEKGTRMYVNERCFLLTVK
jgi:hypothetical protein